MSAIHYEEGGTLFIRELKELLQLLLDTQDYFSHGLCQWVGTLYTHDIITKDELVLLQDYINNNKPKWWETLKFSKIKSGSYYWRLGNIEPRLKWINKHIKKLSK